ncbi:DUF5681 domain-containing protein [Micavibrio aeruginosavorus]|uniref:DUF5681 domain-containing protein n=1 Tax=Micavibrio aeruginosavorus TaxID=349221 RepID=UPI0011D27179|nr:DUF5681 domain-containing protein [Micavibrio aeruginosavorus]
MNDYEVGYGKPPKKNQFKKGQSGNPAGRPKKSTDIGQLILDEMSQLIEVNDGTKKRKITMKEAIFRDLRNKALKGDLKAANTLLNTLNRKQKSGSGVIKLVPRRETKDGYDD